MKNIIDEKPTEELHGRILYSTEFIDDVDVSDKRVLDMGCGFGWLELNLLRRNAGYIVGMEVSAKDLVTVKKAVKSERVDFKVGDATALPFDENEFDTIVAWEVIEHLPAGSEDSMFSEVHRVLKDKSVFYLSTPASSLIGKILDPAWWLVGHRHYSIDRLSAFIENNGFCPERIIMNGGMWEILGMLNLYISKWIFRRRPFFENSIKRKLDREFKSEDGFTNVFIKMRKI